MENLKRLFKEANVDLKTMIVFHKAERLIRASEAHIFKKHQLTPTQFSVLETLYSKGDLRIQDLIDSILATSGNMTVVIRNMVRDGWITRETDPEDRRAYLVSITDAGRKKIEEALPDHIKNIQRLMQVFNSGDRTLEEIQTYRLSLLLKTILTPKSSILEFSSCILFI